MGLSPLNPFVVSKVMVQQEPSAANYTITGTNYTIEGLDNYNIKEFQCDSETMSYRFKVEFDTLLMTKSIEINGHIVHIPVKGKGFARATYSPVSAIFEIKGDMKQLKGIKYYNPKKANVGLDMGKGSIYFEGLFNNNQHLVRLTNEMFNTHSPLVAEAVSPVFEKLAEKGVMRFMKTLTKTPYYQLLPPSR